MSLDAGQYYEIRVDNLAGTFGAAPIESLMEDFYWWSPDLFTNSFDGGVEDVPLRHGGIFSGSRMRKSRVITLEGIYTGLLSSANEPYGGAHLQNITRIFDTLDKYVDTDMFVEIENRLTSSTTATRILFVKIIRHSYPPLEGTAYSMGRVTLSFEVADPDFYESSALYVSGTGAAHTLTLPSITNLYKACPRYTIKIENTDGNNLTDPEISEAVGGGECEISGTISGIGDYWLIDMLDCTVTKHVGATDSDDIASFSGSFFQIPPSAGVYTIDVDNGGTGVFDARIDYRRKCRFDVS